MRIEDKAFLLRGDDFEAISVYIHKMDIFFSETVEATDC